MPRIQFSLKWMMIALTIACVVLFLSVTFGDFFELAFVSVMWCIVPTPVIILAIYGRGDMQAFAIGALVPWVMFMTYRISVWEDSYFVTMLWLPSMSIICGFVAAGTRRWIKANSRDKSE